MMELFEPETITEGDYQETPEFYRSVSDSPSTNRFGADVKPEVDEVIKITDYVESDTISFGSVVFPVKSTYLQRPLVRAVLKLQDGTFAQFDGNSGLVVNNEAKTISVSVNNASLPVYGIARIYNLDFL